MNDTRLGCTPLRVDQFDIFEKEMEEKWIGPLDLNQWLEHCALPSPQSARETSRIIDFSKVLRGNVSTEAKIVRAIVDADICKNIVVEDTSKVYAESPSICLLSGPLSMGPVDGHHLNTIWSKVLCVGDVKREGEDPCNFAFDSKVRRQGRGRLISYAHHIFENGHRQFVLAFIVMPNNARLIRFDRSGVIYSKLFDWRYGTRFQDFLARFDNASDAQRGLDTSVKPIPSDSPAVQQARKILRAQSHVLPDGIVAAHVIPRNIVHTISSLSLFEVYDDKSGVIHHVVAYQPILASTHLVGRSTRSYLAVDIDEGCLVYMKDSWRVSYDGMAAESATLRSLMQQGVRYLPDFYFGGDVRSTVPVTRASDELLVQTTSGTYSLAKTRHDENTWVQPRAHHRILMKKIGRPLYNFKSTWELCHAVHCALAAHTDAVDKAHIMHRDVSGSNILIDKNGDGMLIDWDLSKNQDSSDSTVTRRSQTKTRTGTLYYMAIPLVRGPVIHHHRRFDLELFFYVLIFNILRYTTTYSDNIARLYESTRVTFHNISPCGKIGLLFSYCAAIDGVMLHLKLKQPLGGLILGLLKLLRPIYEPSDSEIEGNDSFNERSEELQTENEAAQRLNRSAQAFIELFEEFVEKRKNEWTSDDGARDMLPLEVRENISSPLPSAIPSSSDGILTAQELGKQTRRRLRIRQEVLLVAAAQERPAKKPRVDELP